MPARKDDDAQQLQELLDYVKLSRGFDFTGYKRTTLSRRIEKRMAAVDAKTFAAYQDFLEVNPREFTELFNTILINVTSFFRDQGAWDFLKDDVIPRIAASVDDDRPIRVWSAACASGEESYTTAMVLAEVLGEDAFKARVKLYATDLDDDALATARHGVFSNEDLKGVPEEYLEKYFESNTRGLAFRPDLRRSIIFGRNDLMSDAPISRIDLLVCRNALMYFTPEAQARIVERFNFALNNTGFLFLGKSEMLITHGELFSPYNLKWRVFRKVQQNNLRERLAFVLPNGYGEHIEREAGLRTAAAALSPVPQVVVDGNGFLADANRRAREIFDLAEGDVGKPFQDVALSYRPADLRSALEKAAEQNGPVRIGGVPYSRPSGQEMVFDIEVCPIPGRGDDALGTSITFTDVTAVVRLQHEYQRSRHDLENAYEELQSTVEELETTNEELQSTNEELETMNEELQSTNDELETMNTEVNTRATELDRVNLFLEGILGSLGVGVMVIDRSFSIQLWNAMSSDLWGLRSDEVEGTDFRELDIGLPVRELDDAIARSFGGARGPIKERVDAMNRRGQHFECLERVLPLQARTGEIYASLILTEPVRSDAAAESEAAPD